MSSYVQVLKSTQDDDIATEHTFTDKVWSLRFLVHVDNPLIAVLCGDKCLTLEEIEYVHKEGYVRMQLAQKATKGGVMSVSGELCMWGGGHDS